QTNSTASPRDVRVSGDPAPYGALGQMNAPLVGNSFCALWAAGNDADSLNQIEAVSFSNWSVASSGLTHERPRHVSSMAPPPPVDGAIRALTIDESHVYWAVVNDQADPATLEVYAALLGYEENEDTSASITFGDPQKIGAGIAPVADP